MILQYTQIFASSPADLTSIEAAREFIKSHGLTSEDVKLGTIGNVVIVETKKEIKLLK